MDNGRLYRLTFPESAGARRRHEELLAQADRSAHDSPAAQALARFQQDWQSDPERVIAECEAAERAAKAATKSKEKPR